MAYARTFETPFNENLLLSSATGAGGLAQNVFGSSRRRCSRAAATSSTPASNRPWEVFLLVDADYFWKYTHDAYDFNTLLNTTITFPIAWHNSKLDGVTGRAEHHQPARLPGLLDFRPYARALLLRRRWAG